MRYRPAAETLVGCVWLPGLAVAAERRRQPELAAAPLALLAPGRPGAAGGPAGPGAVLACSAEARAAGVRPGMSFREALTAAPGLAVLTADEHHYAREFACIPAALEQLSPLVEWDGNGLAGVAWVGLEGLLPEGLEGPAAGSCRYAGPEALLADLERVLARPARRLGVAPRVGVARGKFVAWAAALAAGPGPGTPEEPGLRRSPGGTLWVAEAARAAFLRPFPVRRLPLPPELCRRLEELGLRTLGQVAALSPAAVQAQFGPAGRRAWLLARGQDDEPLQPGAPAQEIAETLAFGAPEALLEPLLHGLRRLAEHALRRPERRGRGVRQARLEAALESGRRWSRTASLRRPAERPEELLLPLRCHLEREPPPEPVEALTLVLTAFAHSLDCQLTLLPEPPLLRRRRLAEALRQLRARTGRATLFHLLEVEPWSRLPERRYSLLAYDP